MMLVAVYVGRVETKNKRKKKIGEENRRGEEKIGEESVVFFGGGGLICVSVMEMECATTCGYMCDTV